MVKSIGGYVPILEQSTVLVSGIPAFYFNSLIIEVVPTRTEVPVSTIPVLRAHDCPLQDILLTLITHQSYNVTLWY